METIKCERKKVKSKQEPGLYSDVSPYILPWQCVD